jgi:UDP-GlcNAc:undecaprenyl-phosphate GlcNAc-1-phosphate transferase
MPIRPFVYVFLSTAGVVAAITPLVRLLAVRFGAIDQPSDRKVHPKPTPTLGGIGLLIGVVVGMGVAYLLPEFRPLFDQSLELQGTMVAAVIIVAVGVVDDVVTLSAPAKVAGQILAAGVLVLNGVALLFFWFPTQEIISLGPDLAVPLTVLWVVVMVNAINLVDGLDGLAAGIVVVAGTAFFTWVTIAPPAFGQSQAALLSAMAVGAALGFLPYNFHPARIFMGDSGAMLLGLLLAAATISGVGRSIRPSGAAVTAFGIPVLIPAIVLVVPLMDVALAIIRRLRRGRPVFAPDKEHIHHQLREIGHTHRRTVLVMYYWSILLAGSALAVAFIRGGAIQVVIVGAALALIGATFIPRRIREFKRNRRLKAADPESAEAAVGSKPA